MAPALARYAESRRAPECLVCGGDAATAGRALRRAAARPRPGGLPSALVERSAVASASARRCRSIPAAGLAEAFVRAGGRSRSSRAQADLALGGRRSAPAALGGGHPARRRVHTSPNYPIHALHPEGPPGGTPCRSTIRHSPSNAVARCELAGGEVIKVQPDAMVAHSPGVILTAGVDGGVMKGLKRKVLGGESFFITTYTAPAEGGWVDVATHLLGDVVLARGERRPRPADLARRLGRRRARTSRSTPSGAASRT